MTCSCALTLSAGVHNCYSVPSSRYGCIITIRSAICRVHPSTLVAGSMAGEQKHSLEESSHSDSSMEDAPPARSHRRRRAVRRGLSESPEFVGEIHPTRHPQIQSSPGKNFLSSRNPPPKNSPDRSPPGKRGPRKSTSVKSKAVNSTKKSPSGVTKRKVGKQQRANKGSETEIEKSDDNDIDESAFIGRMPVTPLDATSESDMEGERRKGQKKAPAPPRPAPVGIPIGGSFVLPKPQQGGLTVAARRPALETGGEGNRLEGASTPGRGMPVGRPIGGRLENSSAETVAAESGVPVENGVPPKKVGKPGTTVRYMLDTAPRKGTKPKCEGCRNHHRGFEQCKKAGHPAEFFGAASPATKARFLELYGHQFSRDLAQEPVTVMQMEVEEEAPQETDDSDRDLGGDSDEDSDRDSDGISERNFDRASEEASEGDSEEDSRGNLGGDSDDDSDRDSDGDSKRNFDRASEEASEGDSEEDSRGESKRVSEEDSEGESERELDESSEGDPDRVPDRAPNLKKASDHPDMDSHESFCSDSDSDWIAANLTQAAEELAMGLTRTSRPHRYRRANPPISEPAEVAPVDNGFDDDGALNFDGGEDDEEETTWLGESLEPAAEEEEPRGLPAVQVGGGERRRPGRVGAPFSTSDGSDLPDIFRRSSMLLSQEQADEESESVSDWGEELETSSDDEQLGKVGEGGAAGVPAGRAVASRINGEEVGHVAAHEGSAPNGMVVENKTEQGHVAGFNRPLLDGAGPMEGRATENGEAPGAAGSEEAPAHPPAANGRPAKVGGEPEDSEATHDVAAAHRFRPRSPPAVNGLAVPRNGHARGLPCPSSSETESDGVGTPRWRELMRAAEMDAVGGPAVGGRRPSHGEGVNGPPAVANGGPAPNGFTHEHRVPPSPAQNGLMHGQGGVPSRGQQPLVGSDSTTEDGAGAAVAGLGGPEEPVVSSGLHPGQGVASGPAVNTGGLSGGPVAEAEEISAGLKGDRDCPLAESEETSGDEFSLPPDDAQRPSPMFDEDSEQEERGVGQGLASEEEEQSVRGKRCLGVAAEKGSEPIVRAKLGETAPVADGVEGGAKDGRSDGQGVPGSRLDPDAGKSGREEASVGCEKSAESGKDLSNDDEVSSGGSEEIDGRRGSRERKRVEEGKAEPPGREKAEMDLKGGSSEPEAAGEGQALQTEEYTSTEKAAEMLATGAPATELKPTTGGEAVEGDKPQEEVPETVARAASGSSPGETHNDEADSEEKEPGPKEAQNEPDLDDFETSDSEGESERERELAAGEPEEAEDAREEVAVQQDSKQETARHSSSDESSDKESDSERESDSEGESDRGGGLAGKERAEAERGRETEAQGQVPKQELSSRSDSDESSEEASDDEEESDEGRESIAERPAANAQVQVGAEALAAGAAGQDASQGLAGQSSSEASSEDESDSDKELDSNNQSDHVHVPGLEHGETNDAMRGREQAPVREAVPVREGVSAKEGVLGGEGVPAREQAPVREGVPAREEVPVGAGRQGIQEERGSDSSSDEESSEDEAGNDANRGAAADRPVTEVQRQPAARRGLPGQLSSEESSGKAKPAFSYCCSIQVLPRQPSMQLLE
jgi:hypothetical protein